MNLSCLDLAYADGNYILSNQKNKKLYPIPLWLQSAFSCRDAYGNNIRLTSGQNDPNLNKESLSLDESFASFCSSFKLSPQVVSGIRYRCNNLPDHFIGVHFRNTDYEHSIDDIFSQIDYAACMHDLDTIYWSTDDAESLQKASLEFPSFSFISYATIPSLRESNPNLHYLGDKQLRAAGISKKIQITDALQDMFCLAKSSHFIQSSKSSFSKFVCWIREDPKRLNNFFHEYFAFFCMQ